MMEQYPVNYDVIRFHSIPSRGVGRLDGFRIFGNVPDARCVVVCVSLCHVWCELCVILCVICVLDAI